MIKAALFDLDGVVFDTEPQYTRFWIEMGRRYHPELPDLAHVIKGQTLVQIYDRFFASMPEAQSHITAQLAEFEHQMTFTYVEGLEAFVTALHGRGLKTAIVTSSNRDKMAHVYAAHPEVYQLFDKILTSEDFAKSTPDPDCYLKGAACFGLKPDECVAFEDSFNGLKAVRAAGMQAIGLATTNSEEAIRPYCDVVLKDYKDWTHKIHLFT